MENVKSNWKSSIRDGEYRRKESIFRRFIGDDGLDAESGRYHLYVSLACPWAHRTLIFRQLKQLQNHISVSVVHPDMHAQGWSFEHTAESQSLYGTTGDILHDRHFLSECYKATDQEYQSNITVPVLWDRTAGRIVNNESSEIIRMFNGAFNELTGNYDDYYPTALRTDIDEVNDWVYHSINNGVYKTGFAQTQDTYQAHCESLFSALGRVEKILSHQRYLVGDVLTEADWRLFTTLIRFDAVYQTHFKCNVRLLKEYECIYQYMLELYQWPAIAETVHMAHIKRHYYASHVSINPHAIVPLGHVQDWTIPHTR